MYPHGRSLVKQYENAPFALIGVNSDEDLEEIRRIRREKGLPWRSFWNGPQGTRGPISTRWGIESWPTTYLIDASGVIRHHQLRGDALDAAIAELVAEAQADAR
ncbi:MAG: TlpA disulfide reductase family protein [Planctomycetota bacterium]